MLCHDTSAYLLATTLAFGSHPDVKKTSVLPLESAQVISEGSLPERWQEAQQGKSQNSKNQHSEKTLKARFLDNFIKESNGQPVEKPLSPQQKERACTKIAEWAGFDKGTLLQVKYVAQSSSGYIIGCSVTLPGVPKGEHLSSIALSDVTIRTRTPQGASIEINWHKYDRESLKHLLADVKHVYQTVHSLQLPFTNHKPLGDKALHVMSRKGDWLGASVNYDVRGVTLSTQLVYNRPRRIWFFAGKEMSSGELKVELSGLCKSFASMRNKFVKGFELRLKTKRKFPQAIDSYLRAQRRRPKGLGIVFDVRARHPDFAYLNLGDREKFADLDSNQPALQVFSVFTDKSKKPGSITCKLINRQVDVLDFACFLNQVLRFSAPRGQIVRQIDYTFAGHILVSNRSVLKSVTQTRDQYVLYRLSRDGKIRRLTEGVQKLNEGFEIKSTPVHRTLKVPGDRARKLKKLFRTGVKFR